MRLASTKKNNSSYLPVQLLCGTECSVSGPGQKRASNQRVNLVDLLSYP